MFSNKDLKVKLVYMGFGGMIAIIGMLFGIGMVSSGTAGRDKFGHIECRSLRVVDSDGKVEVAIGSDVDADGKSGAALGVPDENSGIPGANSNGAVFSWDKDGNLQ